MTSEQTIYQVNHDLTAAAKEIFGDVVDVAYVTTWSFDNKDPEIQKRLRLEGVGLVNSDGAINNGAMTIWIRFTNGKVVELLNSEWGTISPANLEHATERAV